MGIFDRFPYSSTHEMNLDFMLGKATEIAESLQEVQDGLSDIDTHKAQAEQAAQDAAQAKQAAQNAAQAASASAGQAAQHKTDAEDAADRAEAASNLADEAVEHAQTAAQNASTAADGAIASATAAENRINAAAAQAQTDIQAAATQAQTNVQTAADSAVASATAAQNRINALAESLPEDFTELNNDVTDLKSALKDTVDYLDNGELYKGIVKGRYVNNNTKVLSNHSAWDGSWFINISGMDSIVVTNSSNQGTIWNGFFATTEDTTAISTFSVRANETAVIDVPDGANYVILSHYTAQYPYLTIQSRMGHALENLKAKDDAQTIKNTAFTNEIEIAIKNSVSDYAFYFNPLDFELGSISANGFEPYERRVASQKIFQNDMVTHIKSVGDYKFYINLLNDDGTYKNASGWLNDYTVPSGQKFMMMFSPYGSDVSRILDANLIPEYIMNLSYSFETEYEYSGERLIPEKQGYNIKQLGISPNDAMVNYSQGLAVYEHTLFQIVGDVDGIGKIVLVNLDTNTIIKSYDASVGHGGNAFFLDEVYDQSDSYPLLCVCTNEYPNVIRAFRLTTSQAVKVREYQMQEADGYWAQVTYDSQTGLLYSIGYSANSFMDATGNRSVIATYDILTATETSANTFAPTLVSRYAIPFIYCTQGLKYYAGKLIVISSFNHNVQDSRLYIIQPASRQILGIIKDFPILIAQCEVEGIDIVDDEWVLIGTRPRYFKMTLY